MPERVPVAVCVLAVVPFVAGCRGSHASEQPSADHALYLEHQGNETATIDVTVVRNETNETVHDRSYVIDPGEERAVYNSNETIADGIETFQVR